MTANLIGDGSSFDDTVTSPADGDVADGMLFQIANQRHINNAKYLYNKITTGGVSAIRNVANTAALKALTGMVDGQVAYVRGQGLYHYADPSAVTEALPWIVSPTVGTGQWLYVSNALRDVANGMPVLGASGKLATSVIPYATVAMVYVNVSTQTGLRDDIPEDVIGASGSISNPKAGDILRLEATVKATGFVAGYHAKFVVSAAESPLYSVGISTTYYSAMMPLFYHYTVLNADEIAGHVDFKVQAFTTDSTSSVQLDATVYGLCATLIRP